jgi:hypothetical protein
MGNKSSTAAGSEPVSTMTLLNIQVVNFILCPMYLVRSSHILQTGGSSSHHQYKDDAAGAERELAELRAAFNSITG